MKTHRNVPRKPGTSSAQAQASKDIGKALHLDAKALGQETLPRYEADNGLLTRRQLAAIKKTVPQMRVRQVLSSLLD